MAGFWPPSWCSWRSWEPCTVESCEPGIQNRLQRSLKDLTHPPKEVVLKEYCVNSTEPPITALHWPEEGSSGTPRLIRPMQQRRRQCRCHTLKSLIDRFFQKTCKEYEEQVDCHTCFPPFSGIYSHTHKGEPILPCADLAESRSAAAAASANSSKFYAILGGALGTAAFLIIVFCCVRFFFFSSGSRRRVRRSGDGSRGGGVVGGGSGDGTDDPALRRSATALPYPHFLNSELPPAYKDVVAMTVVLPADAELCDGSPNQRLLPSLPPPSPPPALPPSSTPPASVTGEDGEGSGGSSGSGGSEEPPPPSYRDVIAFSPSAANMHQQVLAAAAEAAAAHDQSTI
ncbi:unnamed protein product [Taenia asiatica]|uniref:Protein shisa-9 n=1 Tax=Taenia asiatica TaxID=60517 RepID=A0A0R3WCM8_TAEAS|nr:unnamed protein product [Taenia asiatica]